MARAQAMPSRARAKAATKLSPSPCSTGRTPSKRPTSSSISSFSSATAASVVVGSVSQARVEPSTSPSTKVTVPDGNTNPPPTIDGSSHPTDRTNTAGRFSLIAAT